MSLRELFQLFQQVELEEHDFSGLISLDQELDEEFERTMALKAVQEKIRREALSASQKKLKTHEAYIQAVACATFYLSCKYGANVEIQEKELDELIVRLFNNRHSLLEILRA